jgi:protein SCO1
MARPLSLHPAHACHGVDALSLHHDGRLLAAVSIFVSVASCAVPARVPPAAVSTRIEPSVPRDDLDVSVVDQDGRALRFGRDVVEGKIAVVNFVYTHCTAVCPMQGSRFRGLQTLLRDRLERDVRLVSISIDPENDTPSALRAWGQSFGARPGWVLLTGEPANVRGLVQALLGAPLDREMHSPFLLVGDGRASWKRVYGLASTPQLLKAIDDYESSLSSLPAKEALL